MIYEPDSLASPGRISLDFSLGMKMMRRIKDFRRSFKYVKDEKVADNFYPVNFAISMKNKQDHSYDPKEGDYDKIFKEEPVITIFNDRSQSGGGLEKGQLLLDMNRWSVGNDGKGLPENLDEKPSSERYFTVKHYALFDQYTNKDYVYNLVQKRPILVSMYQDKNIPQIQANAELQFLKKLDSNKSLIDQMITVKDNRDNCFEIDIYHLDSKSTVIQFFNKYDPYFNQIENCEFKFNENNFKGHEIYEVSLNTLIKKQPSVLNHHRRHHNKKLMKALVPQEQFYLVQPQDFKTFIFALK